MSSIMIAIIAFIINTVLVASIPLALIKFYSTIDEEYSEKYKLSRSTLIIILITSLLYNLIAIVTMKGYEVVWINTSILVGYLVFSSYTDMKTKLLYTSCSLAMLVIQIIFFIVYFKQIIFNEFSWTILVVLAVLAIMSVFGWLGAGDVIIYLIIAVYLTIYRTIPTFSIILNLLVANVLFLVTTIIIKIIKKDKEKHQPFTLFITISTVICCLLLI